MEGDLKKCNRFIQLAVGNYKRKNYLVAWKFALRAYELHQTPQIYRLVTTFKSSLRRQRADSSYSDSSKTDSPSTNTSYPKTSNPNTSYPNTSYPDSSYPDSSYTDSPYPDTSYKGDDCSDDGSDDSSSEQTTKMSNENCESNNSCDEVYDTDKSSMIFNSDDSSSEETTTKSNPSCESSASYSYPTNGEINKDESYKCLEKAETYIQSKQLDLAEKLVLKSMKLFHLSKADELHKQIQVIKEKNKLKYTEDQANIVKKVKNSENYYTMLDIHRTATDLEIKKAYKKLALLLHPDKNPAPGSGEVFAVVTNAIETLCNPTKRSTYNQSLNKSIFKCQLSDADSCTQETKTDNSGYSFSYFS